MRLAAVDRTDASDDFFTAAAEGVLLLRRCSECGRLRGPQEAHCWSCHAIAHHRVPAAGEGRLVNWSVVHRPPSPELEAPYLVGLVETVEGPWVLTRVLGDLGRPVTSGERVRLTTTPCAGGEMLVVAVRAPEPGSSGPTGPTGAEERG